MDKFVEKEILKRSFAKNTLYISYIPIKEAVSGGKDKIMSHLKTNSNKKES